jgi:hypothetical protein
MVDTSVNAELSVWLIGFTDVEAAASDHHVKIAFNNQPLGSSDWDGKQAITSTLTITGSVLISGSNQLNLNLPAGTDIDGMWLDAYRVRYARSTAAAGSSVNFEGEADTHQYTVGLESINGLRGYDVTDPDQPLRLTGITGANPVALGDAGAAGVRRYWLTNSSGIISPDAVRLTTTLLTSPGSIDYLVVAPADFIPSLAPLLSLRQNQGLSTAVEDVQAVYDHYGDGRMNPEAIQAFLKDRQPAYAVLAGDGTSDPRRYFSGSPATYIPPYLADVDLWAGATAADNRYAAFDGSSLPSLAIGRLPANSPQELQVMVAKIVSYETNPPERRWSRLFTFIADNPDNSGPFTLYSEMLADLVQKPLETHMLSYNPAQYSEVAMRQDVLDALQQGSAFIAYTGHSSVHFWAEENFFHINQVKTLQNGEQRPIIAEMTCLTSAFQLPSLDTLDESLVRHAGGGAIATWGPTGLGLASSHQELASSLLQDLLGSSRPTLGNAILQAKLNLAAEPSSSVDLIDTFTLLGDPAMHLAPADLTQWMYIPRLTK